MRMILIAAMVVISLALAACSPDEKTSVAATQNVQKGAPDQATLSESAAKPTPRPYRIVDWRHYNGNDVFKPVTLPNGTVANVSAFQVASPASRAVMPRDVIKVADDVWVLSGWFYAPVVIETPNGLIVGPTGEHQGEGKIFRDLIREKISTKPIIAVLIDHAHYSKGTQALLDGDEAMIIAHPDHDEIMRVSGELSNPSIEELLPSMDAKARIHFSTMHPHEGVDAPLGGASGSLELNQARGWMPTTHVMQDGDTITIDGVEVQAFHAITDTRDSLTFWFPKKKMVVDNVIWGMLPNLYTLRGDTYRSPRDWLDSIALIRDLKPEILIGLGGGAKPIFGNDDIQLATNALYDAIAFVYDQSLRMSNAGVPADQIRHYVEFPEALTDHPFVNEVYGEVNTFYEAFPTYNSGWFSGKAEDIHSLPDQIKAEKQIALAGGAENILAAYDDAIAKGEFLWAKDLATMLYHANRADPKARQTLADVFRKLAQRTPSIIVRNFYTAGALNLEGNEAFTSSHVQSADWVKSDIGRAISHLRTRLDPSKANGINDVLAFKISGDHHALHIRRAIAEFIEAPSTHYQKPAATITVGTDDFAAYFRGEISADDLVGKAEVNGDAARFLNVFDRYEAHQLYPLEDTFPLIK